MTKLLILTLVAVSVLVIGAGCYDVPVQNAAGGPNAAAPVAEPTPARNITAADIAKLKWIEGTWKGMDGETPFYERYRLDGTSLVVEGMKADGSADGAPGRFELKDGEFGKTEGAARSAASEIGDGFVQFVSAVPGKGNSFRFVRKTDKTWHAILEWPATAAKPARTKTYIMERWEPGK